MSNQCEVCGEWVQSTDSYCHKCGWYVRRDGIKLPEFWGGKELSGKDLDMERAAWAKETYQWREKFERSEAAIREKDDLLTTLQEAQHKLMTENEEYRKQNEEYRQQIDAFRNRVARQEEKIHELGKHNSTHAGNPSSHEDQLFTKIQQVLNQSNSGIDHKLKFIVNLLDSEGSIYEQLRLIDKKTDFILQQVSNPSKWQHSEAELRNMLIARRLPEVPSETKPNSLQGTSEPLHEAGDRKIQDVTEIGLSHQPDPAISDSLEEPQACTLPQQLSQEEQHLVNIYNTETLEERYYRDIEETRDSIETRMAGRSRSAVFEECRRSQYYWSVQGTDQRYLVPRLKINLTENSLRSLNSLFKCEGELDNPDSFELIKPGRLQSTQDGKWELVEQGILRFKREEPSRD
jgi:hypothetical protein